MYLVDGKSNIMHFLNPNHLHLRKKVNPAYMD